MDATTKRRVRCTGLALVELLIVIAVLAVITAVATGAVRGLARRAQQAALMSNLARIQGAVDRFYAESNYYPTGHGSEIGPQPSDYDREEQPFGFMLVMTAQDPRGNVFLGHYLRSRPVTDSIAYGLPRISGDGGEDLFFGVTATGQVFVTTERPQ